MKLRSEFRRLFKQLREGIFLITLLLQDILIFLALDFTVAFMIDLPNLIDLPHLSPYR
jgi:hypothetical protein